VLVAVFAKNGSPKRIKWNKAGLWISTLYLVFTLFNKWHVNSVIASGLEKNKIAVTEMVTTPTPLNNFLWMSYSEDARGYWFGYYSVFDKNTDVEFYHVDKKEELLQPFEESESVKLLKRFSKNRFIMSQHDSMIFFNDIRFGQMGGWNGPDSAFVFSFKLNKNADNSTALDRSRFKTSMAEAFVSLVNRVKGK